MSETVERAYLVVVAWPPVMDHEARAAAIEYSIAQPKGMCATLARKDAPCVLTVGPREQIREAARNLRKAGVPAMYPTRHDLAEVAATFRCKQLIPAIGADEPLYMCEPWGKRAEARGLNLRQVRLIVKGRIKRSRTESTFDTPVNQMGGMGFGPAMIDAHLMGSSSNATRRSEPIADVMDLYTDEGSGLRIDGSHFNFDLLGDGKGRTDGENMTRLATMLSEQAPLASMDLNFPKFSIPPGVVMSKTSGSGAMSIQREDEGPAFDFYSALMCLIDRAMRRAGRK